MAVKIRLKRMGRHKVASYRIVVADARSPRDGRFIEEVGYYQPQNKKVQVSINNELALKWLKQGAQPTETVRTILSNAGVLKALRDEQTPAKPVVKETVKPVAKESVKPAVEKKPAVKKTPAKKTEEKPA